ncbi:unnamed protein product [Rotaria sp. Silwood1]|nr:unnamed protein product [Rotaria sp. Silwood1]CAF1662617.1 unnamed protein product [Rotaria sp. Silwood1]
MPHLYTFHFDIVTEYVSINEQQPKSTPDDIRPTFTERGYHVDCYIDYEFYNSGRCHVYSLPFHTKRMCHIMHSFAGGMFINVRVLRMKDDFYPFKHKFSAQISRSFPLLSRLMVSNAAFLLPIISNLIEYYSNELHDKHDPPSPLCLILSPTRELALQTEREARKFAYQTAVILYRFCCWCGHDMFDICHRLREGCHILSAPTGRLKDMLEKHRISLTKVKYFVLDQTNQSEKKLLLFSSISLLAQHFIRSNYIFLVVGKPDATNEDIAQTIEEVPNAFEKDHLFQLLEQNLKSERCLIFVETN